jgi:SIKE family
VHTFERSCSYECSKLFAFQQSIFRGHLTRFCKCLYKVIVNSSAQKQENSKIRELQLENKELRQSLDEHQSALELIMNKYREQVNKLVKANSIERSLLEQSVDHTQVTCQNDVILLFVPVEGSCIAELNLISQLRSLTSHSCIILSVMHVS